MANQTLHKITRQFQDITWNFFLCKPNYVKFCVTSKFFWTKLLTVFQKIERLFKKINIKSQVSIKILN